MNFNYMDLAAKIIFDKWEDGAPELDEVAFVPHMPTSELLDHAYDKTVLLSESITGGEDEVSKSFSKGLGDGTWGGIYDVMASGSDIFAFSDVLEKPWNDRIHDALSGASYITETPKSAGSGSGASSGDTYQINIYGVEDAMTLAEQTAREIERMKERRNAAGG